VSWLIEKAEVAVIRHGARVAVIDPWNEIEHSRRREESLTEYTNRALRELKDFGRRFDVLVIVVAHPTKSATNKSPEELTLYDVSDSAAFQNKADLGVIVARLGDLATDNLTGVFVRKVRYQPDTGTIGAIELTFDRAAGMFSQ
jgi:twinkle protein